MRFHFANGLVVLLICAVAHLRGNIDCKPVNLLHKSYNYPTKDSLLGFLTTSLKWAGPRCSSFLILTNLLCFP